MNQYCILNTFPITKFYYFHIYNSIPTITFVLSFKKLHDCCINAIVLENNFCKEVFNNERNTNNVKLDYEASKILIIDIVEFSV